jgi:hypothetical protein
VRAPSVVNVVKVLSVVNARPEQPVNSVANGVKVLSVVNARSGSRPRLNRVVNGVRAPSVVNVRREQAVSVDRSPVAVVVREGQVVLCGCSL